MPDPVIGAAPSPAPKSGRWPEGGKRVRSNRTIPPRPDFDIDKLPGSANLITHEVAGFFRCTPGTVDNICGDDPSDPYHPLHPVTVRGKRLFTVENVRQVLKAGVPRKGQTRQKETKRRK